MFTPRQHPGVPNVKTKVYNGISLISLYRGLCMNTQRIDETGNRYGRLTVVHFEMAQPLVAGVTRASAFPPARKHMGKGIVRRWSIGRGLTSKIAVLM